jgi:hypothetical protein
MGAERGLRIAAQSGPDRGRRHNRRPVPLSRIAWLVTVALAVITGVVLLLDSYTGYGLLAFVVAASAAINLR